ncbi:hypothetical protein [Bacillus andreraoultii]|uniref:hypothetical protein n=1 Tax=Bacillus andreraoultii TaxID=1499685 RepID=UPI000AAACF30|nr:hypothetical protein [Bacillus andreraoultii]
MLVRWLFAILFILIGSILFSLTIDNLKIIGTIIKFVVGAAFFFFAGYIIKDNRKE